MHACRGVGFDIREGEKVLETGARLGPSELGLLAGIGTTEASSGTQLS